nr:MAG TPA: hypothetical protein [Crassvirales sp.]
MPLSFCNVNLLSVLFAGVLRGVSVEPAVPVTFFIVRVLF